VNDNDNGCEQLDVRRWSHAADVIDYPVRARSRVGNVTAGEMERPKASAA